MNASTLQPLRRAEVLASPLAEFAGWHFMATCPTCRVRRYVAVDGIVRRHGGEHQVEAVVSRLRCDTAQCGRASSFMRL